MLSEVRQNAVFTDDDVFDSSGTDRLEHVAQKLPPVITRGATLITGGKVHSKAPIAIPCPKCGQIMTRGTTTLTFHHAPEATARQPVQGWICACGEAYVPGRGARGACTSLRSSAAELHTAAVS